MGVGRAPLLAGLALVLAGLAFDGPGRTWTPVAGGWVSGDVEYVGTVPLEAGGASDVARHGDLLVVSSFRSFSLYDVGDPLDPRLLSMTPLGPSLYNERPQTNGRLLLLSGDLPVNSSLRSRLQVYDVVDPTAPELLSTYYSAGFDHIWTCVLDCAYAYAASGTIVDLRDPREPVRAGDWRAIAPYTEMHVISEIAPGIVLVGSNPASLLDARRDPLEPELLARIEAPTTEPGSLTQARSIPGRVAWPGGEHATPDDPLIRDPLAVFTMETPFSGNCDEASGTVLTFDTRRWRATGGFRHLDTFQLGNGTYHDGAPPYNAVGCSAYGLEVRPGWGVQRRQAAVSFFEHGTRVLEITADGTITEVGGFLPHAGAASNPIWITDDVLYVSDLHRGLDVLRVAP